jgi:hypothetical protein
MKLLNNLEIELLYKSRYDFELFYKKVNTLLNKNKNSLSKTNKININYPNICCSVGDIRVDLPISIGDKNSKYRIVILGLEPRDSNSKFNIEKHGKYVFGTPFGIEHWDEKSKYFKCFKGLLEREDCFLYFTDVVKEYEVGEFKEAADRNARKTFKEKASKDENIKFLRLEMDLIKPTHILALGYDTYKFLSHHFGSKVVKVIHPNARQNIKTKENSWDVANRQILEIF